MDQNVFALLGDDENADPHVLAAKAPKPVKKEAPKEEAKPGESCFRHCGGASDISLANSVPAFRDLQPRLLLPSRRLPAPRTVAVVAVGAVRAAAVAVAGARAAVAAVPLWTATAARVVRAL